MLDNMKSWHWEKFLVDLQGIFHLEDVGEECQETPFGSSGSVGGNRKIQLN